MDDDRFVDTVIYLCHHTDNGAWGFIINQPLPNTSVGSLLHELELASSQQNMNTLALQGGPIHPEAGFILHTGQPEYRSSFAISENICLTTSKDILELVAEDKVSHFLMCMGFCRWSKGQLEKELFQGDWFVCPADLQLLFGTPYEDRRQKAFDKLGINPLIFVDTIGTA